MSTSELYRRAARLIHEWGLCKGAYRRGARHCVLSAINDAFYRVTLTQRRAAHRPLWFIANQNGACVFAFNDHANTTAEHVETLLCFCAAMVEQGYQ